ncbi:MAG TPA: type II secretion system protein GspD [Sedimenticola thiotaurini]|uniref:Type II secretion system protein GspD n=1 Tax=Sedimenticola thiotaurini TaxID=1543721 RepID=A0A831W996_9GAMM|nr:type II secretion system protein GspD [Sedimenticola thiotaurini]
MPRKWITSLVLLAASGWQLSCTGVAPRKQPAADQGDPLASYSVVAGMPDEPGTPGAPAAMTKAATSSGNPDRPRAFKGSDLLVRAPATVTPPVQLQGGGLVLNFENADLRDVVRTILGDFLKVAYIYDPRVQGKVSLQTTRQLGPDEVLATLETVLRMNGAAMVPAGESYRIVPVDEAAGQTVPQLGDGGSLLAPLPAGYRVVVVPLKYSSALQMEKLLQPFVGPKSILRADADRNLLVLAGTSREVAVLLETVQMFDVDWLAGMSIGLYPLSEVSPEKMIPELDGIFGTAADGPLAGLVRYQPIERLNAILVITPRSSYLDQVGKWIRRLDRSSTLGQNLYVYYLENGKAADIAMILEKIFARDSVPEQDRGRVAPGLTPVEVVAAAPAGTPVETGKSAPGTGTAGAGGRRSEGLSFSSGSDIRIIADEVNNSLLILATPQDHRMVVAAIRKLDIVPLQVLIEATIAEVKLNDRMRFGLQWFFKSGDITATLSSGETGNIGSDFPGFSLVFAGADAKVILDALDKETSVNIVSSPHLMVLDNQTASLQVGDEVPVITRQQQSTATDANLVNTVEYRNTGVIMNVTPRVNPSGSIIMEVEQEVSNVVPSTEETLTPTISQRKFKSSVVVQSGDTVVLGGLIFDFTTKQRQGLPLLSRLPLVGALFGSTESNNDRTELVMLITPRLVRDRYQAKKVTEEVRRRLQSLRQLQKQTIRTPVMDQVSPLRREAGEAQ